MRPILRSGATNPRGWALAPGNFQRCRPAVTWYGRPIALDQGYGACEETAVTKVILDCDANHKKGQKLRSRFRFGFGARLSGMGHPDILEISHSSR
jgi:hypothetical protein